MSKQFRTAYRTNIFFYFCSGLLSIVIGLVKKTIPLPIMIVIAVFIVGTIIAFQITSRLSNIDQTKYGMFQSIAFVILNLALSFAFDSAQVFIYAMCFSTILSFVFIDTKLSKFQLAECIICCLIFACGVALYTMSPQTMLAFSFGMLMLVVTNIVIVSMTNHINFQYRKNYEQERSLDDMLKVVETKCDEAQEATRAKSRFLAHMSHEIRTPINAVIGMNEMILRESTDREILDYASETKAAADSLLGIINDILDITRIESGKLVPIYAEYSPANLINNIYNMIRFKADDKKLTFNVYVDESIPSRLKGDDIRLKQILINLLSNAIKYTHEGSVTLEVRHLHAGNISFAVSDTGIGIKPEDIKRLFNAFDRMEEEKNRSIEGTGLGLNITSSLLKMLGSSLKVESVYGEGSTFSFMLSQIVTDPTPIGELDLSMPELASEVYHSVFTASKAKLLVVDDNDINRHVFINLLKKTQMQIHEAASGAECLEKIRDTRFDIIFMDHMMPEMDGVETFRKIRSDGTHKCVGVPVIILTANAIVGAEESYLDEGFNGFLSKPINPQKLETMIFSLLDKSLISEASTEETPAEGARLDLPIINGIDWGYARLHFDYDDAIMMETLKMFRNAISSDAAELDRYFSSIDEEKSIDSYRIKVHSMKSSAALVGIVNLAGMAMELESSAQSYNSEAIKALHPMFISRWKSYEKELSELCGVSAPKKNASEYTDEIREITEKIRSAAAVLDVDVLDEMSQKLEEFNFDGEATQRVAMVRNAIFNFETEKLKNCEIL